MKLNIKLFYLLRNVLIVLYILLVILIKIFINLDIVLKNILWNIKDKDSFLLKILDVLQKLNYFLNIFNIITNMNIKLIMIHYSYNKLIIIILIIMLRFYYLIKIKMIMIFLLLNIYKDYFNKVYKLIKLHFYLLLLVNNFNLVLKE